MNRIVNLSWIAFLFGAIAILPTANAQDKSAKVDSGVPIEISVARCAYTRGDEICAPDAANTAQAAAQLPRRMPVRPPRPVRGYPGGGYPGVWATPGNGRHALIGAAIGFGLGAALGARANTDRHPGAGATAAVLVGCFGALIGAAVGNGVPSLPSRRMRHNRWPDEDESASVSGLRGKVASREPAPEGMSICDQNGTHKCMP